MHKKIKVLMESIEKVSDEAIEVKIVPKWESAEIRKRSRDGVLMELFGSEVKKLIKLIEHCELDFTFEGIIHAYQPQGMKVENQS